MSNTQQAPVEGTQHTTLSWQWLKDSLRSLLSLPPRVAYYLILRKQRLHFQQKAYLISHRPLDVCSLTTLFFSLKFFWTVQSENTSTLSPVVLALHVNVLVAGWLQGWLLWEDARSFPCAKWSQSQPIPVQDGLAAGQGWVHQRRW